MSPGQAQFFSKNLTTKPKKRTCKKFHISFVLTLRTPLGQVRLISLLMHCIHCRAVDTLMPFHTTVLAGQARAFGSAMPSREAIWAWMSYCRHSKRCGVWIGVRCCRCCVCLCRRMCRVVVVGVVVIDRFQSGVFVVAHHDYSPHFLGLCDEHFWFVIVILWACWWSYSAVRHSCFGCYCWCCLLLLV